MVDLNKLTIKYIEKIAKDCSINLNKSSRKAEKIKQILNADISSNELNDLFEKYLSEYTSWKTNKLTKSTKHDQLKIENLEIRINKLENQVKYLVSILAKSSIKINKENTSSIVESYIDTDNPKNIIKSIICPGESISIDYLIKMRELQRFPIKTIELAVKELIFERSFNAFEGKSSQKLDGNISILTRVC